MLTSGFPTLLLIISISDKTVSVMLSSVNAFMTASLAQNLPHKCCAKFLFLKQYSNSFSVKMRLRKAEEFSDVLSSKRPISSMSVPIAILLNSRNPLKCFFVVF